MKKIRRQFPLSVTVDGKTFEGSYVVEGTRALTLYVIHDGQCVVDHFGSGYPPDQVAAMESIAREILIDMVSGQMINAVPCSKFGIESW